MNEEVFRKKSLDKVKSPENLDDYIQLANPGVWLIIISVVVLLIGACIWGAFGHVDSIVETTVRVDDEVISCNIPTEDISFVMVGTAMKVGDYELEISSIGEETPMGYPCTLKSDENIEKGFYPGKIVIKSVKPLSFIFN